MTVHDLTPSTGNVIEEVVGDLKETPGMGQTIAVGALMGFVALTVVVTLFVMRFGDVEFGGALGLGLFTGTFGGSGFGGMMGGVVAVIRSEDDYG